MKAAIGGALTLAVLGGLALHASPHSHLRHDLAPAMATYPHGWEWRMLTPPEAAQQGPSRTPQAWRATCLTSHSIVICVAR